MRSAKKYIKRLVLTVLLLVGIVLSFWIFIQDNTQRIAEQNEEYIEELTIQRAISVDSLISENLSFIQSIAYLYGKSLPSPQADVALIRNYEDSSSFDMLRFVDKNGDNYTSSGVRANLSDRAYFQAGIRGESGVTYVLTSRVTGQRQIGFYAPVLYGEEIIGVMVGFYGEDYIQKLLEYELFGFDGEGWLCTLDGTVLGSTLNGETENYLDYLRENEKCSEQELSRVISAFASGESISLHYREGAESSTAYAVKLTQVDWILVRSFPPSANTRILKNANREGEMLISVLLALFAVYGLLMAVDVVVDQKRMKEANRNANDVSTGMSRLFSKFVTLDLNTGEYSFITGEDEEPNIPPRGDYELFTQNLIARIPEEGLRQEARAFMRRENLRSLLMDSDRTSIRVHAPLNDAEWFTVNFIVIARENGQPSRVLIVGQDVTELHHKEQREQQRLQQALDTAEKASRAKTEFLFNMSHDLRTPMNAIIGYTELAQREGVTEEQMRGFVEKIDASSVHLLALINDILEMSRIESGKMTLDPVETDLTATMEEARSMFAAQMAGKKIAFSVACELDHPTVLCDKNRLNRILLNLLSNAYKFTPEGGTVSATIRETGSEDGEGLYEIRVKDNGIGMSPAFAQKLFKPFERERTSTVSGIQGTGLGLSITKSIVDLMGGTIRAETEQGAGTEFILSLRFPLIEHEIECAPADENEKTEVVDYAGKRLLLVEDNPINREIAVMILSQAGFQLDTAENGQIALDKVTDSADGYYDAVLMDIQMPVMDGYTAARAIRALPDAALSQIPIVAMTANAFAEDAQAAAEAGMNGHIAKPLDVDKMMETLQEVLGRKN